MIKHDERQLEFVWFKCPKGHDHLINHNQVGGAERIWCRYCAEGYMVDEGKLGEAEQVRNAFPNLLG